MKTIYLICGKPGCGKTTLAKMISDKFLAVHFSADDFMLKLFGQIDNRTIFEEKLKLCKNLIYDLSLEILKNSNVVLDFGFWTKQERIEVKNIFCDYNVKFIYINKTDDIIYKQIEERNKNLKSNEYYIDKQLFNILISKFEEPTKDENMIVIKNKNDFRLLN